MTDRSRLSPPDAPAAYTRELRNVGAASQAGPLEAKELPGDLAVPASDAFMSFARLSFDRPFTDGVRGTRVADPAQGGDMLFYGDSPRRTSRRNLPGRPANITFTRDFRLLEPATAELDRTLTYAVSIEFGGDFESGWERAFIDGCGGPPWPDDGSREGSSPTWWRGASAWIERVERSATYRALRSGQMIATSVKLHWAD